MDMNLNDWCFDDLKKELSNMTLTEMQNYYINKEKEYINLCTMYFKSNKNVEIEKDCVLMYNEKLIIATKISDRLTGVQSIL